MDGYSSIIFLSIYFAVLPGTACMYYGFFFHLVPGPVNLKTFPIYESIIDTRIVHNETMRSTYFNFHS